MRDLELDKNVNAASHISRPKRGAPAVDCQYIKRPALCVRMLEYIKLSSTHGMEANSEWQQKPGYERTKCSAAVVFPPEVCVVTEPAKCSMKRNAKGRRNQLNEQPEQSARF
jgi:hypothetical protein